MCYNICMLETINTPEKKQSNRISLYENGMQIVGLNVKTEGKPSEFKFFVLESNQALDISFPIGPIVKTFDTGSGMFSGKLLTELTSYSSEEEAEAAVGSKRIQTTHL